MSAGLGPMVEDEMNDADRYRWLVNHAGSFDGSADSDSPWLICKPCAAVGRCAKFPVAWRSKEHINGEFDSGWKLTSNEPPQTPRTIAIEPLYTHPPQQRKPLMHMQIVMMWGHRSDGPDTSEIVSFARAVERAHGITEAP